MPQTFNEKEYKKLYLQWVVSIDCWNKKCNHARNGLLAERSRFEIWEVFIFFIFIKAYILYARIQTVCARVQVAWCRVKTRLGVNKRGAVRIDNNKDLNSGLRSRDS